MARCDDVVWQIPPDTGLHSRCWSDECVIYNPISNDTHLVDIIAEQTLLVLLAGPRTHAQLASKLTESLTLDNDEELKAYLEVLLPEFDKLGLIEKSEL